MSRFRLQFDSEVVEFYNAPYECHANSVSWNTVSSSIERLENIFNKDINVIPWFYSETRVKKGLTLLAGLSHTFTANSTCTKYIGIGAHYQYRNSMLGVHSNYARF